jgi:hypothetical protein
MRWCWVLTVCAMPALAADTIDVEAQRERIARERVQIEEAYRLESARCAERFSVTACVDDARRRRRAAMENLDHERAVLDDMQRKRRAAERTERIQEKLRAVENREAMPVQVVPRAVPEPSVHAPEAVAPAQGKPTNPRQVHPGAEAAYDKRLRDAAEHREAVERRNAERAARRAPAASLPSR